MLVGDERITDTRRSLTPNAVNLSFSQGLFLRSSDGGMLFFFLDEKEPKNQGCIQILRFCRLYGGFAPQTRPSCVGAQTGVLSTASKAAKSGFE